MNNKNADISIEALLVGNQVEFPRFILITILQLCPVY
jgi:hypothetical protein